MTLEAHESGGRYRALSVLARIERRVDAIWIEDPVRRWDAAGNRDVARAAVATGGNLTVPEQFWPLPAANDVGVVPTAGIWGSTHFLRAAPLALSHGLPVSPVGYNANPPTRASGAVPNHRGTEIQVLADRGGLTTDHIVPAPVDPAGAAGRSCPDGPDVRPAGAWLRLVSRLLSVPGGKGISQEGRP